MPSLQERLNKLQEDNLKERLQQAQEFNMNLARSIVPSRERGEEGMTDIELTGQKAGRRFIDQTLALPSHAGELLAHGGAAVRTAGGALGNYLSNQPQNLMQNYNQNLNIERQQFPASALSAIPTPTTADIMATGKTVQRLPEIVKGAPLKDILNEERLAQAEIDLQFAEDNPGVNTAGNLLGDMGMLLSGRAPFSKNLREFSTPPKRVAPEQTGAIRLEFQRWASGDKFQAVERGMRRAAETGLDAAALAILQENDPVKTALAAAGAQAAASTILQLTTTAINKPVPTLVGAAVAWQVFTQAAPGIQQNVFTSIDNAIAKALGVVGIGMFAGIAGLGRLPKPTQDNLKLISDSLTAGARVPMLSVLGDLMTEKEQGGDTLAKVMKQYQINPDYFGPVSRRRLERAMENEKISLLDEIQKMSKGRGFQQKLRELDK
jgi:hypothetical protein